MGYYCIRCFLKRKMFSKLLTKKNTSDEEIQTEERFSKLSIFPESWKKIMNSEYIAVDSSSILRNVAS